MQKQFNIFRESEDYGSPLRRHLCIDIDPHSSKEIREYLYSNLDDFLKISERILTLPNMYYDGFKREYTDGEKPVSAMRFFDSQNTRIYCQEMTNELGHFFIICAKIFDKKSQRNNKKNIPILKEISAMTTHINHNDLKNELQGLFKQRPEGKEVEHDAFLLMAAFLSEIECIQRKHDISRKQLAEKIKISPSYLTQVFRSKKPLNFLTLAKIKRALNIRFEVTAISKEQQCFATSNNSKVIYFEKLPLSNTNSSSRFYPIKGGQFGSQEIKPAYNYLHQTR